MEPVNKYRIIIGGGGTGGHIFPAISIANAVGSALGDSVSFLFVGATGKIEMEKVPEAGYEIVGLPVSGFQRKLTWRNITFFFKLLRSMQLSRKLIRTFDPHLAIGVGGYASGPIVKAAARRKVPVVLQEQNSYAGVTNRILAKSAEKICVAYQGMDRYFPAEKIVFTGNPVRQDLLLPGSERDASFHHFGLDPGRKVILLIGGSGGAKTLNESVMEHIDELASSSAQLIWQSGKYYHEAARLVLQQSGAKNIILLPFIREMNRAFQVADLVISRAGAGTISELCMIGKPVILVPSPNVAEDHQTSNARALTDANAGILVHDRDAKRDLVGTALQLLYDTQKITELSENIKKLAIPDASERIAGEVINLLKRT
jgi:UDP-N-acetylglucosamine--N-acetylmuramyl-(pentapeptide) pyrophosphoryl-undecaprenol N-acetylglucosamine transferase